MIGCIERSRRSEKAEDSHMASRFLASTLGHMGVLFIEMMCCGVEAC